MTVPITETETDANVVPEGGSAQPDEAETDQDTGYKPPREKRYREERNAARQERDALAARVEAFQTRELLRHAADLAQPEDLLSLGGRSLADFLTEDGEVDPEAVAEVVSELLESRPGLSANPTVRATDPSQGLGGNPAPPKLTFGGMLQAAHKG